MVNAQWSVAIHGRHGQLGFVVADEKSDQLRRFLVAGVGRYLVDAIRRLVEAFSRLVDAFGPALYLKRIAPWATYPITVQGWLCGLSASPGA